MIYFTNSQIGHSNQVDSLKNTHDIQSPWPLVHICTSLIIKDLGPIKQLGQL